MPAQRPSLTFRLIPAALFAILPPSSAAPATGLLDVLPPTPMVVKVTPSGSLDLQTVTGNTLENCRPYLASRVVGTGTWVEENSTYHIISQNDGKLTLEAPFAKAKATLTIERDAAGRLQFSGRLDGTSAEPLELARFHYLDGHIPDPALNLLSMRHYELPGRIIRPSEKLKAPLKSNWGWTRLDEPVHRQPNAAISGDSGLLARDWNTPGFFFGFTAPGAAFGEIGMRTAAEKTSFFLAVLLDAVRLDPGKSRLLENATVSFGDPQDEFRHWIRVCRDLLGPARLRPPLTGYCSWYQAGQGMQPDDIRRALQSFSTFAKPPGGHTIQLDDGYQVCPGDWTGRGAWKDELDKLPGEIKAKGFIPGIWIAPTAIHASHPIVRQHPEWLQRNAKGEFCITFHNWKDFNGITDGKTYFLEPDHPQARQFILTTLRDLRARGWDYFKIDFAYTVSSDRVKYDPGKTTCESLRDQWQLFREGLGEDAIINSCNGGMWRYTIGRMDLSRLGGDIGGSMKHLRRNLAEMMLRCHANGVWFQADPDVFYLREEKSDLNFEQSHLLTATQGLLGTAFLTSDFADQWTKEATEVAKTYWNAKGPRVPAMLRVMLQPDGLPAGFAVAHGEGEFTVALYNWAADARDISIRLADLRLPGNTHYTHKLVSIGKESVNLENGILSITSQPAESLRAVTLR
jgi:hypothetical protein